MIVKPGTVTTAMTNFNSGPGSVKTENTSLGTLIELGKYQETGGALNHTILNAFVDWLPNPVYH